MPQTVKPSLLQRPLSKRNGCLFGLLVLVLGFCAIPESPARKAYKLGLTAYEAGNCPAAINHFKQAIDRTKSDSKPSWYSKASAKQVECQAFQAGINKQTAGDAVAALTAYSQFIQRYASSPLLPTVRQEATALFNQVDFKALVKPEVCDRMAQLQTQTLIPQPETNLPRLYNACGTDYAVRKKYPKAIAMYERVLDQYPKHSLATAAKAELVKAIVADARAKGTGSIPAPEASGSTGSGDTVVVIQNASPSKLRLVFSGPTPRLEELPACKGCTKYINTAPASCPKNGTVGTYTLKPGDYNVLVKTIGATARPFAGNWALSNGTRYNSCFFIVQRS